VGSRHLTAASVQTDIPVALEWKPFLLNPHMSDEGENLREHLTRKYGLATVTTELGDKSRVHQMGRAVGIEFNNDRKMVNTIKAHALVEAVKDKYGNETANMLMEKLYTLYFECAVDINDENVLAGVALSMAGMDASEAAAAMGSMNRNRIRALDRQIKNRWGVSGVPFFIIEPIKNKSKTAGGGDSGDSDDFEPITFSGAQPINVLAELLQQAAAAARN
jgi:predicted DsbA family dithiol-disulfide isomerase